MPRGDGQVDGALLVPPEMDVHVGTADLAAADQLLVGMHRNR